MTRQNNWYHPDVISRVRKRINFILIIICLLMLYFNHSWMIALIKQFINNF
jgi:hypothetical protein